MLLLLCTNCGRMLNSCNNRKFAEYSGFQDSVNFFETLEKEEVSKKVTFVHIGACVHDKLKLYCLCLSHVFTVNRIRERFMIQRAAWHCSKHQVVPLTMWLRHRDCPVCKTLDWCETMHAHTKYTHAHPRNFCTQMTVNRSFQAWKTESQHHGCGI